MQRLHKSSMFPMTWGRSLLSRFKVTLCSAPLWNVIFLPPLASSVTTLAPSPDAPSIDTLHRGTVMLHRGVFNTN